jgi:protein with PEP-CTERM/exosortase system signal
MAIRLVLLLTAVITAVTAHAVSIGITGTLNGLPVNASGTLTAGNGSVTVVLNNLQADPTSIIQCISGLSFDVTGATGSGILTSTDLGKSIDIAADGTYSVVNKKDPLSRWTATGTGTHIVALTTLSGGSPDLLIIGPPDSSGLYASANPSITGDNPSVFKTATFTIDVQGVTTSSTFANATFYFGTSTDTVGGSAPDGGATIALLGFVLIGIESLRRRLA